MGRVATIAWREFATTVRRLGYLLATVGTPLFFLVIAGISAVPSLVAIKRQKEEQALLAVVDQAGLLTPEVLAAVGGEPLKVSVFEEMRSVLLEGSSKLGPARVQLYERVDAAQEAVREGTLVSFYVVPEDYVESGRVDYYTRRMQLPGSSLGQGAPLRPFLQEALMAGKVAGEARARVRQPVASVRMLALQAGGEFAERQNREVLARFVVPFGFAFILMLSIFIASGYLIQGLVEEKSSRVIELLLSRVTPDELVAGKLVGLGGAGLLQLVVWVGLAAVPALALSAVSVSPRIVALSVMYYLVGFMFFGSIMAGVGCVVGTTQESQQLSSLWAVVAVIPMLFSPLILEDPNGTLSRVLSYVPVTSPMTMMMRCAAGKYVWWDVPMSLIVMVLATWLSIRLSGRLFRMGLLMRGQRPSVRELWGYLTG